MEYTVEQVKTIVEEAKTEARRAAEEFFMQKLGGRDQFACGFAWVNILGVKGNTRLGRTLKAAGIRQDWNKLFQIWDPSGYPCQNVDTLYTGAVAAAAVLKRYGFDAYAGSRLD